MNNLIDELAGYDEWSVRAYYHLHACAYSGFCYPLTLAAEADRFQMLLSKTVHHSKTTHSAARISGNDLSCRHW